jgi:uncharacterized protein (DUF433 family)
VKLIEQRGVYPADRAAALSGVPLSTVHYWARREILVPSVSPTRVKLWSYVDLMGLRTIYWLRQEKTASDGRDVPRTTMPAVRKALNTLRELDLSLWTEETGPPVAVDRSGHVWLRTDGAVRDAAGAAPLAPEWLDLIEPFSTREGSVGPDLQAPKPNLRIVPGKLAGSPHIAGSRIETVSLAALADRGLVEGQIHALYPAVAAIAIGEAIALEHQLRENLKAAA